MKGKITPSLKKYFDSREFRERYHYDGVLGALWAPGKTTFRLWAPTAQDVTLRLFKRGRGGRALEQFPLAPGEQGVWSLEVPGDLDGVYYDYRVTVDGVTRRTADPYAVACGLEGGRSMVVDLRRTDPEGWAEDRAPARQPETVIYELHVKDFSWDPASGVKPEWRGKFKAFCQEDATLNGDGVHPTCLPYLRGLGVTHVQLLPVFDYGSVAEGGDPAEYNWGYDPVNYNVPEGSYSTDPADGAVRIRELKEAVQSLHKNGLRVIMDVVYNHTYHLDSWLWRTVPGYYCRQRTDGTPSNGSGCGNDLASERSMCGKYILDSVLYWAEEYHIDGFRFDLMGLLDAPLMNRIRRALDRRYGPGEKVMLGEPWSASDTAARPGTRLANKGNLTRLNRGVAAFCDATRDAVKGSLFDGEAAGFVNGGGLDAEELACCLRGWADGWEGAPHSPAQTVNYLSCHDDWTLWDKLIQTGGRAPDFQSLHPELLRQNKLAAAIDLTCQGTLFFLAGEEFARTKYGVKNSYRSPAELNRLDWNRAWENRALVDYYRGLIALRKQAPGLMDKSEQAAARLLTGGQEADDCAGYLLDNSGNSPWHTLALIYNASLETVSVYLPEGTWEVLVDGESSFLWQNPGTVEHVVAVPPVSALILGQR